MRCPHTHVSSLCLCWLCLSSLDLSLPFSPHRLHCHSVLYDMLIQIERPLIFTSDFKLIEFVLIGKDFSNPTECHHSLWTTPCGNGTKDGNDENAQASQLREGHKRWQCGRILIQHWGVERCTGRWTEKTDKKAMQRHSNGSPWSTTKTGKSSKPFGYWFQQIL